MSSYYNQGVQVIVGNGQNFPGTPRISLIPFIQNAYDKGLLNFTVLPPGSISLAEIQDISTAKILGRSTAGSGVIEQISIGTGLSLSGGTLTNSLPDQTVTISGATGTYPNFTITPTAPGGSTTQIQFNSSGAFSGTSEMTWDATNKRVSLNGIVITKGGTAGSQSSTNLAIGVNMSSALNTSGGNLAIGQNALSAVTSNSYNVAIGVGALRSLSAALGDSSNNVAIGWEAGRFRTPFLSLSATSNSIFIGYQAQGVNTVSPMPDNQIVIGAQAIGDGTNTIRLGNTSITDLRTSGAITSKYSYYGTGSPEGVVIADIGSFYSRTDGGAGTSFYVKESNSGGNTGWVPK